MKPFACAKILGNTAFPNLYGEADFYEDPSKGVWVEVKVHGLPDQNTEILRQYFINHPQSIDKYTFLQNSAFTHWVKEKCSKMC